jgi:hypothetical protein
MVTEFVTHPRDSGLTTSMRTIGNEVVRVVGAGRALLEARGGRSGSLALLYSCAVLVSAAID